MASQQANAFIEKWTGRGDEKQDTQTFWNDLIYKVLESPDVTIDYEKRVKINNQTKFIDAYLPATKVLIEQKSLSIDLMKTEKQSDGAMLTPYQQGQRYGGYLPYDEQPRWIIDSNFAEIRVHDMKKPGDPPEIIKLEDLEKDYTRLKFMVSTEDEHIRKEFEISVKAGEIVGVLYDKLLEQYKDPDEHDLQSLNRVCVRIVFCLYAEDAGLFGSNTHAFHDYMEQFNGPARFRNGLKEFFQVLNQPLDKRDKYLDPELAAFPYVNGGLFADDDVDMPFFTDEIVDIILERASSDFDWSDISPTIFGAIFESTLNPETRRSGGMHYTSIENIHKVIDPLFLDNLKEELASIKSEAVDRTRARKLKEYQDKIASLKFLDPACGSGNFLTESYLCLRRLENEVIEALFKGQIQMAFDEMKSPIKVSIQQFYGIEINDFACATAQTAMWIAEAKTMQETEQLINQDFDFFPLTNNANIVEGNALRMDWNDVVPASELNYIMGNPPFVGARLMSQEQKDDVTYIFDGIKGSGNLDYVSCWYMKSFEYMKGTDIISALVSTNSVTQGEPVSVLWRSIMEQGLHIDFAHRTFRWDSEASIKAHVHCVIVGFSCASSIKDKWIYRDNIVQKADNINAYLVDAPDVFIDSRKKPLSDVPPMVFGNMANDGGFLFLDNEEKINIVQEYPEAAQCIRPFMGSREFINNINRYCIWLKDISPSVYRSIPHIVERITKVQEHRSNSNRASTRALSTVPFLFGEIRQPDTEYILVPRHSSERRRYIPLGFMSPDVICGDANMLVPTSSIYHFGVMTSNVHMAWMRTVCGRIKSDYRYSASVVYNNFPWPTPTYEQMDDIKRTAQGILDARALYPDASLADLYDELTMPVELRKAHQANDRAVMDAYGFSLKMTEQECVAELMKLYQALTETK